MKQFLRLIFVSSFKYFVFLLLLLGLLGSIFSADRNKVQAAASVTLSSSGYSDPDAEDNHIASQWIVRDSSSTIYDSGTDAVNLTSITLSGSLFTNGTTYYWKVRYQDEHEAWSDYSDESIFVYSDGSIPSPTPTPTPTPTVTPTLTATATSTVSSTATPTPTVTASPVCGPYVCQTYIEMISADVDCEKQTGEIVVNMYNPAIALYEGQVLSQKIPNLIVDMYLEFDASSNYFERVLNDYDYLDSYSWGRKQGYLWSYLQITANFNLPQNLLGYCQESSTSNALVHSYSNIGQSWGDSLSLITNWQPFANLTEMAVKKRASLNNNIVIDDEIISKPCLMEIESPRAGDSWDVGSQEDIIWNTDKEYLDEIKKINISLSRDGGKTTSDPLLVNGDNSGFFLLRVIDRYVTNNAVLQFVGTDQDGEVISYCKSDRFEIKGKTVFAGLGRVGRDAAAAVLLLGALTSILPLLLTFVARVPAIASLLSRVNMFFMPPAWPKEKPAWGIVYDAVSKKPISKAVMRIFSEPDGKQRDIQVSNERGEFGFLVPAGGYSITASVHGYNFPTQVILSDKDGRYVNLYRGGKIKINESTENKEKIEKAPVSINIPMDPTKMPVLDIAIVGFMSAVHKFASTVRYPIMVLGSIASIYLAVVQARFIDYLVLAIYIVLWILEVRDLFKKKTYGIVVDERGNPVPLAVVRFINPHGRIVTTMVTGDDGKFMASVKPDNYRFDVVKLGYNATRSKPYQISRMQDFHRVRLEIEKIAKSESTITYRTDIAS